MEPSFVLLGLVVGVLVGATGVGAGSLVTPALALAGVPPAVAVGTDLAYAAVAKSAGALAHRAQRTLDLRVAGLLALGSVPAAALTVLALAATGAHHESGFITAALALALILTALALLGGRTRLAALAATLIAGAVPGIVAGSLLAGRLPEALVRRLLAFVLLLAGARLAAASL